METPNTGSVIESKKAFVRALIEAKKEFKKIVKDHKGVHNSKHATLDSCIDACEPALNKHGLVSIQFMKGKSLVTKLMHVDGHEEGGIHDLPLEAGSNNPNHSEGGAMTYFRRYDFLALVNQQPEGEDTDGVAFSGAANVSRGTPGKISEKQLSRLYAIATKGGWDAASVAGLVDEKLQKLPADICWGDEYDRTCAYFENNRYQG